MRRPQRLGDIVERGAWGGGALWGGGGGEAGKKWSLNHPGPFLNGTSPPRNVLSPFPIAPKLIRISWGSEFGNGSLASSISGSDTANVGGTTAEEGR